MRKRKMLIGVLTAAMLLGNVSPAMVQGAQAADVTEVPAETETEELATEVVPTETEEAATEIEVTETEEEETTEDAYKTADAKADKNGFIIEDGVLTGYTGPGGDIVIPKGVTSIGNYAFEGSGLKSVVIPASVTSIGDYAFKGTGLTNVVIPASVTDFGDYIFEDCDELQYVTFSNGITKVQVKEGGVGKWFSECKKLKKLILYYSRHSRESG